MKMPAALKILLSASALLMTVTACQSPSSSEVPTTAEPTETGSAEDFLPPELPPDASTSFRDRLSAQDISRKETLQTFAWASISPDQDYVLYALEVEERAYFEDAEPPMYASNYRTTYEVLDVVSKTRQRLPLEPSLYSKAGDHVLWLDKQHLIYLDESLQANGGRGSIRIYDLQSQNTEDLAVASAEGQLLDLVRDKDRVFWASYAPQEGTHVHAYNAQTQASQDWTLPYDDFYSLNRLLPLTSQDYLYVMQKNPEHKGRYPFVVATEPPPPYYDLLIQQGEQEPQALSNGIDLEVIREVSLSPERDKVLLPIVHEGYSQVLVLSLPEGKILLQETAREGRWLDNQHLLVQKDNAWQVYDFAEQRFYPGLDLAETQTLKAGSNGLYLLGSQNWFYLSWDSEHQSLKLSSDFEAAQDSGVLTWHNGSEAGPDTTELLAPAASGYRTLFSMPFRQAGDFVFNDDEFNIWTDIEEE